MYKIFKHLLTIIVFSFLCVLAVGSGDDNDGKPKTKEEIRKDKLLKHFSSWDGSHINLTKMIKQSMNDPSSYDHDKTVYWDNGDHLIVKTTFRGKNAFGGVVVNWVKAKTDLSGNVIAIIEQGP